MSDSSSTSSSTSSQSGDIIEVGGAVDIRLFKTNKIESVGVKFLTTDSNKESHYFLGKIVDTDDWVLGGYVEGYGLGHGVIVSSSEYALAEILTNIVDGLTMDGDEHINEFSLKIKEGKYVGFKPGEKSSEFDFFSMSEIGAFPIDREHMDHGYYHVNDKTAFIDMLTSTSLSSSKLTPADASDAFDRSMGIIIT